MSNTGSSSLPLEPATEGHMQSAVDDLLNQADRVAEHLGTYQKALASVCIQDREARRRRLSALYCLMQSESVPRKEVLEVSGIGIKGLKGLEELGLVEFDAGSASLTRFGENFLALLHMFTKQVDGVTSEGYLEMLSAVAAGSYSPTPAARLMVGSLRREARRTRKQTVREDATALEVSKVDRDLGTERVNQGILTLIKGGIAPDIEAELRSASTDLTQAIVMQRQVVARVTRENFTLPQGKKYLDLEHNLKQHSWTSFEQMLQLNPGLFFVETAFAAQTSLTVGLRHAFAKHVEPASYTVTQAVQGTPPLPVSLQMVLKDLEAVKDQSLWHKVATNPRSYIAGLWFANTGLVPREIRQLGVTFEWHEAPRIQKAPLHDCPTVIVRKAK